MFESLAGKLEGRRGVGRSITKGLQFNHDKGKMKSCSYINARSIRNKFLELKSNASLEKFDIIFIIVTWVTISI